MRKIKDYFHYFASAKFHRALIFYLRTRVISHSLKKFRIYVYGRKIKMYIDSQALTIFNRCVITSNRVTRWLLAIRQYDIEICHIKGTNNVLADILGRYQSELSVAEPRDLSRPCTIMLHAVDFKIEIASVKT